jgi:hypothetical protein
MDNIMDAYLFIWRILWMPIYEYGEYYGCISIDMDIECRFVSKPLSHRIGIDFYIPVVSGWCTEIIIINI